MTWITVMEVSREGTRVPLCLLIKTSEDSYEVIEVTKLSSVSPKTPSKCLRTGRERSGRESVPLDRSSEEIEFLRGLQWK